MELTQDEVELHPGSVADPGTRVFRWQGGLYRGIGADRAALFDRLLADGTIAELCAEGLLVGSRRSDLCVEGFELVVAHDTVPFVSYAEEWCAPMLRDAGIALLDFGVALARRGLALEDGHLANVLFAGSNPLMVDLGSIRPFDDYVRWFRWTAEAQLRQSCLFPLLLMAGGRDRAARLLLASNQGVLTDDLVGLPWGIRRRAGRGRPLPTRAQLAALQVLPRRAARRRAARPTVPAPPPGLAGAGAGAASARPIGALRELRERTYLRLLEGLRATVLSVPLEVADAQPSTRSPDPGAARRLALVEDVLRRLAPATVLDVGTGDGSRARAAAALGATVVSIDRDPDRAAELYLTTKATGAAVLPLVVDVTEPTPPRGLNGFRRIGAEDRLRCELVLVLNVLDRMVAEQLPTRIQLVEGLARLATRWLVVEDERGDDRLRAELEARCRSVEVVPFAPAPSRLLICVVG